MGVSGISPFMAIHAGVWGPEISRKSDRVQKRGVDKHAYLHRLDLSIQRRKISQFDKLIRMTPDVRESKIEQVCRDLEYGTYSVKADKIAEKTIGGSLLDDII